MKMKMFLLLYCAMLLTGCASASMSAPGTEPPPEPMMQIGNPWVDYDTLNEAEEACGFNSPLPLTVAGSYTAQSFRVMNGELLEVVYRDGEFEVMVRICPGENQDISGVYEEADTVEEMSVNGITVTVKNIDCSVLHLISADGCSYCLYAPNGYQDSAAMEFLNFICFPG